jgi:hypothetical protein
MKDYHKKLHVLLFVITITGGSLLAALFLFMGVGALMSPGVPEKAIVENTIVGTVLILTAASSIYALFRPSLGGVFLCLCSMPCAFVFNAFHLSHGSIPREKSVITPFGAVLPFWCCSSECCP